MKFVFLSYGKNETFSRPEDWIFRIRGYTGILETLARKNQVISIEQINYEGIFSQNKVDYHFLRFSNWQLKFPFRLHKYVKSLKPDVVFVHGMHFPFQIIQLRKNLDASVRIIVQNHAELPAKGFRNLLQKKADACINAYLFTALQMGDAWISQGIIKDRKKIHEVMEASSVFYPLDKNEALNITGAKGSPVFLWVGRLDANKDPLTVVKSFLRFVVDSPNAHLYMIFHTDELLPQLKAIRDSKNSARDSITFIGKVDHEKMLYWYNAADFIISGSHYEGSGVAVCEAMSCGCIPIVTNILSFVKITNNGRSGFLFEPGNEDALTTVLKRSTKISIHNEKEKVLQQFYRHLSFDAIAEKIQEIAGSL